MKTKKTMRRAQSRGHSGFARVLTMLVLLMTAATGAWAQDAKHLITATYDEQTRSLEQPLPYATTVGELYEAVTGQSFSSLISTMSYLEMTLSGIGSTNTSVVSVGEFNGASTPVTVNADGKAAVALRFGSYAKGIFVSVTPPLYVTMKDGVKDADKWTVKVGEGQAQALPIGGLKGDGSETVTLQYNGRLKVKGVKATSDAAPAAPTGKSVDLSTLTADYEAQNGDVLSGETTSYKVTIAAGATVTLDGVNISSSGYCIKCAGDATIILKDGSTNTLTSTGDALLPALSIGDANTTLTIQGSTGVLNVESGDYCAGIGGGYSNTNSTCGNIRIEGGVITVQGGYGGAGIGTDVGEATCGDIIITGGTITANGGGRAAGIGGGTSDYGNTVCGNITIANTVTKVTATAGNQAPYSIGKGYGGDASCGTVTIGCSLDSNGNIISGTGSTGPITTSPYNYPAPAGPTAYTLAESTQGMIVGTNGKAYDVADMDNLPTGVTAAGVVVYKDGAHGLALALTDEASTMAWQAAIDACSAKNTSTPVTGATWLLASKDQWDYMLGANGAGSYTALRTGFSGITGASNLQSASYWSSTEYDSYNAYYYYFKYDMCSYVGKDAAGINVRACLAF